VADCDPAADADDDGEPPSRGRCAGVRSGDGVGNGDGAADGTATATGDVTTDGVPAVSCAGRPWPDDTVITTAAVAAAKARSAIAPVVIPVRKLTSSSRAFTAARMPGHGPTARCSPPCTPPDDTGEIA
jgi:hypothetical protein